MFSQASLKEDSLSRRSKTSIRFSYEKDGPDGSSPASSSGRCLPTRLRMSLLGLNLDTEALCTQLITQFGEKVARNDLPVAKVKKKKDSEVLKVRRGEGEALQSEAFMSCLTVNAPKAVGLDSFVGRWGHLSMWPR